MMPKIFFYTTSTEGSPENAYFQDLIINLATGFDQLGIEYYANYNYWQISPDSDRTLLKQNADITHHDCDIVVLERQYYEKNGCLPEGLFAASRQYKTVYLDCNDGIRTLSWLPEFKNFDFIFKTHYAKHTNYPDNFYPWAFGLSERVLTELEDQIPWAEKQPSVLVNFRNKKFSHSLRGYIQKSFAPEIQKIMPINAASDSESDFPQDPYHYLRWSQTGRRHYPNYFRRLQESQACACFGGFFLGPEFTDKSDRISHYISKIISMAGVKTNRIGQWDSWRFWESMVAGCITLHVDFEKYGFELPVMPENWRHYIGIDLDNITESIERIADQPELLEYIATEGRAWAIAHYAPKPTAIRFLETVAGLKSADLVQLQPEVNLVSPMNPDILVSIIINNYNYERFLAEAIDSALNQTYEQIEVIVVDDGSTDNSRQIIGSYGDRIIPILQSNGKQAAAFNSGFAHSRGEIIIFLDSDDYLFPQAVTEIVKIWQPNLAKVHYRLNVVDGVGESLGYSSPQGTVPLSQGKVWQTLLETGCYNSTPTSGNALSRQALTNLFPIPDQYKLTADDYLSFQVPFYGDVAAIEQPLGVYRVHDSNQWALATVTGDRFKRFVRHDLQNFALLTKKAQELGYKVPPDLEQRSIGRLWSRIISLRLNAQTHPVQSDRSYQLIYQGIRSLWKYSEFNFPKRIFYSLWFIWVGLMPLSLAKPAISWLFAPHHRPKLVSWTTNKLRTLMS